MKKIVLYKRPQRMFNSSLSLFSQPSNHRGGGQGKYHTNQPSHPACITTEQQ